MREGGLFSHCVCLIRRHCPTEAQGESNCDLHRGNFKCSCTYILKSKHKQAKHILITQLMQSNTFGLSCQQVINIDVIYVCFVLYFVQNLVSIL